MGNDDAEGAYLMNIKCQKLCWVLSMHTLWESPKRVPKGQAPESHLSRRKMGGKSMCKRLGRMLSHIKHSLSINCARKKSDQPKHSPCHLFSLPALSPGVDSYYRLPHSLTITSLQSWRWRLRTRAQEATAYSSGAQEPLQGCNSTLTEITS